MFSFIWFNKFNNWTNLIYLHTYVNILHCMTSIIINFFHKFIIYFYWSMTLLNGMLCCPVSRKLILCTNEWQNPSLDAVQCRVPFWDFTCFSFKPKQAGCLSVQLCYHQCITVLRFSSVTVRDMEALYTNITSCIKIGSSLSDDILDFVVHDAVSYTHL